MTREICDGMFTLRSCLVLAISDEIHHKRWDLALSNSVFSHDRKGLIYTVVFGCFNPFSRLRAQMMITIIIWHLQLIPLTTCRWYYFPITGLVFIRVGLFHCQLPVKPSSSWDSSTRESLEVTSRYREFSFSEREMWIHDLAEAKQALGEENSRRFTSGNNRKPSLDRKA